MTGLITRSLALLSVVILCAAPSVGQCGSDILLPGSGFNANIKSFRELRQSRVTHQQYDFSCGSAALATLLTFTYGTPVSETQVFKAMFDVGDQANIKKVGFSLLDMQKYLKSRGLHADGYKLSVDQLRDLQTPAILLISPNGYNHFVVMRGWEGDSIMLADPIRGLKTTTASDLEGMWNGIAFVIKDSPTLAEANFNNAEDRKIIPRAPFGGTGGQRDMTSLFLNLRSFNEF